MNGSAKWTIASPFGHWSRAEWPRENKGGDEISNLYFCKNLKKEN